MRAEVQFLKKKRIFLQAFSTWIMKPIRLNFETYGLFLYAKSDEINVFEKFPVFLGPSIRYQLISSISQHTVCCVRYKWGAGNFTIRLIFDTSHDPKSFTKFSKLTLSRIKVWNPPIWVIEVKLPFPILSYFKDIN